MNYLEAHSSCISGAAKEKGCCFGNVGIWEFIMCGPSQQWQLYLKEILYITDETIPW